MKPGRVTLDHLTIDHVGPSSDGILEHDGASNFTITNSSFSNIPNYAISVLAPSFVGIGANNVFNGGAMIRIMYGTITSTTSWVDPGTPIAVDSAIWVDGAADPAQTTALRPSHV